MSKVLFLTIFLSFFCVSLFAQSPEYNESKFNNLVERAKQYTDKIGNKMDQEWFSSKEKYEQNLQKPLVSNIPLYSLDRKTSGNVQLECPGRDTAVEILIQPSSTRDLKFIQIVYDVDLDGRFDGHISVPGPISGVCANGFIKCDAGTWKNCHYYKWLFDSVNKKITYKRTAITNLGGCFCFNQHCTNFPFFNYKDQILRTLGGGIAGALMNWNPAFVISAGEIDGFYIRFFAQNSKKCNFNSLGNLSRYGLSNPEDINQAEIASLTQEEVKKQQDSTESPYYILKHSIAYTEQKIMTCTKQRIANFDSSSCDYENTEVDNCAALERNSNCRLKDEKIYDVNGNSIVTIKDFNPTGLTLLETCKKLIDNKNRIVQCLINCKGETLGTTDGGCKIGGKAGEICYAGHVVSYSFVDDRTIKLALNVVGHGNCVITMDHKICGTGELRYHTQDDPCIIIHYGDDSRPFFKYCYWSDAWQAYSYRHTFNSGNSIKSIKVYVTDANKCNTNPSLGFSVYFKINKNVKLKVCHNWWKMERTYVCTAKEENPDLTRVEHVAASIQETNGGITYNDIMKKKKNGPWIEYTNQKINFKKEKTGNCIPACKLRVLIKPAQVASDYTTADYRQDPGMIKYIYRECVDGSCPVKPGEEMLEGCRCLNDFNKVISINEVLRLSTMDMICSSGKKH